jgi:pyruvate carboxylase subunit B
MRYFVDLRGTGTPIEVVFEEGRSGLVAHVEGLSLAVDLVPAGGACFSLLVGTDSHDVVAETLRDGSLSLSIGGERSRARVELESERDAREFTRGGRTDSGGPVLSSMPGIVVRVLKAAGEAVIRGETVVIVEAMKMENEVKADHDGVVTALSVKAGDRIQGGDRLFDLGLAADNGSGPVPGGGNQS